MENLSADLQRLLSSYQSVSETKLLEEKLQKTNHRLELTVLEQTSQLRQLEAELYKEHSEDEKESFLATFQSEFQGKVEAGLLKSRCLRKDGSESNVFFWSAPLRDGNSEVIGSMRIYSNITDSRLIEVESLKKLEGFKNKEEPFWVRYVRPPKRFTKESER